MEVRVTDGQRVLSVPLSSLFDRVRAAMLFSAYDGACRRLCLMSCLTFLLLGAENLCASVVTVQTVDGRELTGQIDSKTDAESIWIRREEENIVLTTAVAWSSISAARLDGEPVEVAKLADLASELVTEGPVMLLAHHVVDSPREVGVIPAVSYKPVVQALPGPVASLEIEAFLVNLDRDVEPDGLEVLVAAVDVHGQSVPVRGNLYVRLWGDRDVGQVGRVRFEDLQRWSQPVRPTDFEEGVASYSLRFRTVHPEFDWDLMPYALLNVRLGVYGQGNYEATVPVQIREFNPFRDRMQLYERSRFFRDELSQEVRRQNFAPRGAGIQAWSR